MPTSVLSARLVLRKKDDSNPIDPFEHSLYKKLEENEYKLSCLSVENKNALCTDIEYITGINPKIQLKALNLDKDNYYKRDIKSKYMVKTYENTFKMLIYLAKNKIMVDFDLAEQMCLYWNNKIIENDIKEFSKINVNHKSKTFKGAAIALTFMLHSKTKSIERTKKVIDIILDSNRKIATFTYFKNNIYGILANKVLFNKKFEHIFEVQDAYQFRLNYFYKGSEHEKVFNEKFKNLFINTFFGNNKLKGKLIFSRFKIELSRWFDEISSEFVSKRPLRNTCGLKLIGNNQHINSLLQEYFIFLTTQKSNVLPTDLMKEGWWASFVDHVRYTYGYSDFWKVIIRH